MSPDQTPRISQAVLLLKLAENITPFSSDQGQAWASIPVGADSHQVWPLRSARVRDWLIAAYYRAYELPPGPYALRQTLSTLEARAHTTAEPAKPVDRRIAARGDRLHPEALLLDLDNAAGDFVEITASGWKIESGLGHSFRRSRGNLALPQPIRHAGPAALHRFLNVSNRRDHALLCCWLTAALRPSGPYPILVLTGPSGSGKSIAASMLRQLIDPSTAPLQPLPESEEKLLALAWHNRILAFDDVKRLSETMAGALCRLASGSAFFLRERGDEREPLRMALTRPIIVTSTKPLAPSPEFAGRSIVIDLPGITPDRRRTEESLFHRFESLRPTVLGTLCNAASTAIRNLPSVRLPVLPRMADFTAWAAAAAPAFALSAEDILTALFPPAPGTLQHAVESFLQEHGAWTGTATQLLDEFRLAFSSLTLPATPKGFSQALRKLPNVHLIFRRLPGGKLRLLTIKARFGDTSTAQPAPKAAQVAA